MTKKVKKQSNVQKQKTKKVVKIWLSFVIFSILIFFTLWILQAVLFQYFYNSFQKRHVKISANKIQNSPCNLIEENLLQEVQNLHLLALVFDENLNIIYLTDEHSVIYEKDKNLDWCNPKNSSNKNLAESENIKIGFDEKQNYLLESQLKNYFDFASELSASQENSLYKTFQKTEFLYGIKIKSSNQIIILSSILGPVAGAKNILKTQLIIVTISSLILAFIFAYILSKKLSDEKLQKARIELLANITHDLRTPLTLIRGYTENLRDFTWNNEEKRNHDTEIIIRETERLNNLINDVLDYASIKEENNKSAKKFFNFSQVILNVVDQFGEENFNLEIEADCFVTGDQKQLERVLYNFCDNAIRHSPEDKKVFVKLCHLGKKYVHVEVQNYGQPIPPENLLVIWDRYFTARQQGRTNGKSGLGLAITRSILENHKAKFGVTSDDKKGTVFWTDISVR